MRRFFMWTIVATAAMFVIVPSVWSADKPDFGNPDAVFSDLRKKIDQCGAAGAKNCMVRCGYALKTLKNFIKANPEGDPSIFKQRWQSCSDAYEDADLKTPAPATGADGEPDFRNHGAVVASMRALRAKCGGDAACVKECDYQIKSMKNFNHPQPHYVALRKGKWEKCRDKVPSKAAQVAKAKAKAKPTYDRSKFVIGGLQLGGDMNTQKQRFFLLEAYGYHKKTKLEHNDVIMSKTKVKDPGPDIIRNYKGMIREAPVYIHFEATADGRLYMIQFEQKEDMDADAVKAALIKRYGKPTKRHGTYLNWGCDQGPQKGLCVKANAGSRSLTIWAFDEDIKNAAHKAYRGEVLKAKGVKKGMKF